MPNFEQPEEKVEVPKALLVYEKLWVESYGKTKPEDQIAKLEECAKQLLNEDPKFEAYLSKDLVALFKDGGLENKKDYGWALVHALSTRGKEFGLQVD